MGKLLVKCPAIRVPRQVWCKSKAQPETVSIRIFSAYSQRSLRLGGELLSFLPIRIIQRATGSYLRRAPLRPEAQPVRPLTKVILTSFLGTWESRLIHVDPESAVYRIAPLSPTAQP